MISHSGSKSGGSRKAAVLASSFAVLAMLIAFSNVALAGGFQLTVETPSGSNDAELREAVLLVRTFGCYTPADANLSGSAEGLVGGVRRSIHLDLLPTTKGVYAVKQQWPSEGRWVLSFSGAYNGMTCSVLVDLGEGGRVKPGTQIKAGSRTGTYARSVQRKWTSGEIDAAINGSAPSVSSVESSPGTIWSAAGVGAGLSLAGLFVLSRRRGLRGSPGLHG